MLRVTDHAPDQPHIRRRDAVVPINIQGGQSGHVNTEDTILRDIRQKIGIKPVYPFRDNNMVVRQLADFTGQAFAELEIKVRKLHLLALHQSQQITIQLLDIERVQRLEIVCAGFVFRREIAVYEIVVHCQCIRLDAICHQLNRQPLRERGFASRGRPSDQHQSHPLRVTLGNGSRDLTQVAGLQGFRNEHLLAEAPACNRLIKLPDVLNAHHVEPLLGQDKY